MTGLDDRVWEPSQRPELRTGAGVPRGRVWNSLSWVAVVALLLVALAGGVWRHYRQHVEVAAPRFRPGGARRRGAREPARHERDSAGNDQPLR
jgi:hypothetical protein